MSVYYVSFCKKSASEAMLEVVDDGNNGCNRLLCRTDILLKSIMARTPVD